VRKPVETWFIAILLGFALPVISCSRAVSPIQLPAEITVRTGQEHEHIQMSSDSSHSIYTGLTRSNIVYDFYRSRSFEPLWINDSSNALTDSLFTFLKSIRLYGLLPQNYHISEFEKYGQPIQGEFLCRKEALLTDAFLSIANDLKYGRLDSTKNHSRDSLILKTLELAIENGVIKTLESQEPINDQYKHLKKSLRKILYETDSINFNLLFTGITYDSVDLHKKVQCIEINMERWRSEKTWFDERYIWINIPSFQLQLMDTNRLILESRIIVGKLESQTPVLSSLIECITLFPYWLIPRKIAIKEYLPEIQKDTSFLTRNNFDVLDRKGNLIDPDTLNWEEFNTRFFPVSLRQREGPENSLGVIKFVFDNPYAVFLHDTNVKSLFQKKVRMFSHGCIRMEKALELAKYLVNDSDKVEAKLRKKERFTINLKDPISIYVRYFTCDYVNDTLNFYDDIYGLDESIIDVLYRTEIAAPDYDQNQVRN